MGPDEVGVVLRSILDEVAPDAGAADLTDRDDLAETLDLDSMDHLAVIERIGERLGVEVPERDYPYLRTLGDAVTYLAERA